MLSLQTGRYRLRACCINSYSYTLQTDDIVISQSIFGMSVALDNVCVNPRKITFLNIYFIAIARDSCICIEQGDGVNLVVPLLPESGYEQCTEICVGFYPSSSTYNPITGEIKISLNYRSEGVYNISVRAFQGASMIIKHQSIWVNKTICNPPKSSFSDPKLINRKSPRTLLPTDR